MEHPVLFAETQRFRQLWIWALFIGFNVFAIYGLLQQIVWKQPFGDKPMSDLGLVIAVIFSFLMTGFMWMLQLETIIREDGIYVRFFPFHIKFRHYPWEQITKCYVRVYNPILEYGGWGLRGLGKNRALNVSGNNGIQLVLDDGAQLLIGTNMPDEAAAALRKIRRLHE